MLNKNTKILYITGTRADYGLMRHSLLTINKLCDLKVAVTGMHLEEKFGYTLKEIEKDNLNIIRTIKLSSLTDKSEDLPKNLSHLLIELGNLIQHHKVDYVIVEGDRMEALALAIVASSNNIPVIHQGGGDTSGSIDNEIRNAITSFSDYHLAGNINSAKKLESIGVSKKRIYIFGEPGLDDIVNKNFLSPAEIYKKYNIDKTKKIILLIHHPDTKEKKTPEKQIQPLLQAIKELKIPSIIVYPNSDPGGLAMIKEIEKYKNLPYVNLFPSLPRADFLGLMNVCNVMTGNSSSGLVETGLFNVPFVNIGARQENRLADVNVANCNPDKSEIIKKIKENLGKKGKFKINYIYGKGMFTKRFVNFLEKL